MIKPEISPLTAVLLVLALILTTTTWIAGAAVCLLALVWEAYLGASVSENS